MSTTAVVADTITVDNSGEEDYTSIQQAVNNSNDGDTILVNKGVYVENVDVDKKLTIISKSGNPEDTIIQALNPNDHVFHVTANNVTIKGFGLNASSESGIYLDGVQYNTIANNHLWANGIGIHLWHANNNILINNTASNNSWAGIRLSPNDSNLASNNTLVNNTMVNNLYNFVIDTGYVNQSMQNDIDTTNTVNGKPIYYFVNASNVTLNSSSNAGAIYCINCQNISIRDQIIQNGQGIYLHNTSSLKLDGNIVSNNIFGIFLDNSNNNNVLNNIAINNGVGIAIVSSTNSNLSNNVANSNGVGFNVLDSDNTELNNNTANFNEATGIDLGSSIKNELNGNIANYNYYVDGIKFSNCSDNLLNNNVANSNRFMGIDLGRSSNNTLIDNIANSNNFIGINLVNSKNNTLIDNTAHSNEKCDFFRLPNSNNTTLKNNTSSSDPDYLSDNSSNYTP